MDPALSRDAILTEAEATAALQTQGFHVFTAQVPAADNAFHWHEFDSRFYILEGCFEATDRDSGRILTVPPGGWVETAYGQVHRERHNGYTAVFGISVDPSTLTLPLEKEPPSP